MMGAAPRVRLKRAYEPPADDDGCRVLIDRLWPRGVGREELRIDRWAKELAPSDALRRWFGHDPERFEQFRRRYLDELAAHADAIAELREIAAERGLTVVFAARDVEHCNAAVLGPLLREG